MIQSLLRKPLLNLYVLTSIWGELLTDLADEQDVTEAGKRAGPWAELFWHDLLEMAEVHPGGELETVLYDLSAITLFKLFIDPAWDEARVEIAELDLKPLRARRRTVRIPPPGWYPPPGLELPSEPPLGPEGSTEFQCDLIVDGTLCQAGLTQKEVCSCIRLLRTACATHCSSLY